MKWQALRGVCARADLVCACVCGVATLLGGSWLALAAEATEGSCRSRGGGWRPWWYWRERAAVVFKRAGGGGRVKWTMLLMR